MDDRAKKDTARFLRTLRVATQSALAEYEMTRARRDLRSNVTFLALAAKGAGEWRFPVEGLLSADGLVLATLETDGATARALVLQAQGAAGLARYAGLQTQVCLQDGHSFDAVFDRDGRLALPLDALEMSVTDFSGFAIETGDDAS